MHWKGYKISSIVEHLVLEDGIIVSKQSVQLFLKQYSDRGTIDRKEGSGLPPKLSPAALEVIDTAMKEDDELTATQLQSKLAAKGIYVSLTTILRNRKQLGWVYRGSAYCQLIRNVNKEKRLEWARANILDTFENVIWSDESTI